METAKEDCPCQAAQTDFEQVANVLRHDLQDTLRQVLSYLRLLESHRLQLSPNDREFLGFALDSADRCQHLVSGLLAYARVAETPVNWTLVDCREVVEQVLEDLQLVIEDTQAVIEFRDLPHILADQEQMELVFRGIIETAVNHCRDCPPRVQISVQQNVEDWLFIVLMLGPGIKPEAVEQLFSLFSDVLPVVKDPGADLAICRRAIQNHGGKIWAVSSPAEGVRIFFSIPKMAQSDIHEVLSSRIKKGE